MRESLQSRRASFYHGAKIRNSAVLPLAGNLLGSAFPKPCSCALISEKDGLYNTYHEQKQRFKELQTVKRNIDQILRRDEPHRRKEQSHER